MARTCILRVVLFADVVFCLFSGVTFVFVLFRFRLIRFIESTALRPGVLRYACVPTATRSWLTTICVLFFYFVFVFLWRCGFFRLQVFCIIYIYNIYNIYTVYIYIMYIYIYYRFFFFVQIICTFAFRI